MASAVNAQRGFIWVETFAWTDKIPFQYQDVSNLMSQMMPV